MGSESGTKIKSPKKPKQKKAHREEGGNKKNMKSERGGFPKRTQKKNSEWFGVRGNKGREKAKKPSRGVNKPLGLGKNHVKKSKPGEQIPTPGDTT